MSPDNPRPNGLVAVIRSHPLVSFFVISYAVTWLLWSPVVLLGLPAFSPTRHAPSLYVLPAIAIGVTGTAFALTAVTQGRAGVRRLLQRLTWWRVGPLWFLVAVLILPVTSVLVAAALGASDIWGVFTPTALVSYPAAYAVHFIFGPLFEESGWRGFALPRMQHRFGPARGSLLLGLLWSGWHFFLYAPVWFASGDGLDGLVSLGVFVVTTTAMTFAFTWLSNNTRASLLLTILMHGSVDGTATYLQVLADRGVISADSSALAGGFGLGIGCVLLAVVLLVGTRGQLGCPRYRQEAEALDLTPAAAGASPLTETR